MHILTPDLTSPDMNGSNFSVSELFEKRGIFYGRGLAFNVPDIVEHDADRYSDKQDEKLFKVNIQCPRQIYSLQLFQRP